jgi:hypothetical protein
MNIDKVGISSKPRPFALAGNYYEVGMHYQCSRYFSCIGYFVQSKSLHRSILCNATDSLFVVLHKRWGMKTHIHRYAVFCFIASFLPAAVCLCDGRGAPTTLWHRQH